MTNQAILTKAIQKAHDNGFPGTVEQMHLFIQAGMSDPKVILGTLMVDHRFAKALWGEQEVGKVEKTSEKILTFYKPKSGWQHHLQQMVISENPIEYLGENI